jgi:hypothetical protein
VKDVHVARIALRILAHNVFTTHKVLPLNLRLYNNKKNIRKSEPAGSLFSEIITWQNERTDDDFPSFQRKTPKGYLRPDYLPTYPVNTIVVFKEPSYSYAFASI